MRFATTTAESAVDAAIDDLVLVLATSYQLASAIASRQLRPVLRDYEIDPVAVSLVYHSKRLVPLKLRAFLDFAAPRLSDRLGHTEASL